MAPILRRKTRLTAAVLLTLAAGLVYPAGAQVLSAEQVVQLKEAGAGKKVITRIIESQAIFRGLVTVDGVVKMKNNGVSDETIVAMIKSGNPTLKEAAIQDKKDRLLKRRIKRQEKLLKLQRKRLDVLADHLRGLINNEAIQSLVEQGKISGEHYRGIVKYLKQYARDEPTDEDEDNGDINVDIDSE